MAKNLYRCENCGMVEIGSSFDKCPNCMEKNSCVEMKNTKLFKVAFSYTETANIIIDADTKESAEEIVLDRLNWDSLDAFNGEQDTQDREYEVLETEVL